jgi:hypothetical protein
MDTTHVDAKELCVRQIQTMADGTLEDFEAVVHPDARNREDVDEPPASRGRGPAAFYERGGCATPTPNCAGTYTRWSPRATL